jgi:hypothetical protein
MHFGNWFLIDQFGLVGFLTALVVHAVYNYNGQKIALFFAKHISEELEKALREQYAS